MALFSSKKMKRCEELLEEISNIKAKMVEFNVPIRNYTKQSSKYIRDLDRYCEKNSIEGKSLYQEVESEQSPT